MPVGEQGWGYDTLPASLWGTQESGTRGLQLDEQAGGRDGQKSPYATAKEAGPPWGEAGTTGKQWRPAGI